MDASIYAVIYCLSIIGFSRQKLSRTDRECRPAECPQTEDCEGRVFESEVRRFLCRMPAGEIRPTLRGLVHRVEPPGLSGPCAHSLVSA